MKLAVSVKTLTHKGALFISIWKIMRLTVILIFAATLNVCAKTYSQKITIHGKNLSMRYVLDEVGKQSGYSYIADKSLLKKAAGLNIDLNNATVDMAMKACLRGLPYTFRIEGSMIVIKPGVNPDEMVADNNLNQVPSVQIRNIKGRVTDSSGKPLPGTSVIIKGTRTGSATDNNGDFILRTDAPGSIVLVISAIGYEKKEITVSGNDAGNIVLKAFEQKLDDIVIIGYGTEKKTAVTGGIDVVKSKAFEGRAVPNVSQALEGTAPSLVIQQKSFEPGQPVNINLRGVSSLGNNSPLVVIDGVIGGDINNINPNDIASVSVLKDAGAAAIYGSRSANGVILITTKQGQAGNSQLSYNGIATLIHPHTLVKPVPGWENMFLKDQALVNSGQEPQYTPLEIQQQKDKGDDEWFLDQILQNSLQQNHNLTLSGGAGNTTYLISGGYMAQNSNFVGPQKGVKRYNFRMNLSTVYKKLKVTANLSYARNEIKDHSYNTGTLIVDAERTPPLYQMKDSAGRYLINDVLNQFNPLGILDKGGYRHYDNDDLFGTITGDLTLAKGLTLKGVFGGTLDANHEFWATDYVPFFRPGGTDTAGFYGSPYGSSAGDNNTKNVMLNTQLILQYAKTIGKHDFLIMGGYTTESYTNKTNHFQIDTLTSDLLLPQASSEPVSNLSLSPYNTDQRALNSFIGRATYSYAGKYYFESDFRADGSSVFAANHRWGYFPSISGGWLINKENFFQNSRLANIFDLLKLRASYGILGSQNVQNSYEYQTTYFIFSNAYAFNNTPVPGTGYNTANPDLQWETAHTFNIGTDIAAFHNKLTASFDYFHKLTTNILQTPTLPGTYGGNNVDFNIASVRNEGWEVTINYNTKGRLFSHALSFNIANTRNEITHMANNQDRLEQHDEIQVLYAKGLPIASYVGLKRNGYFQNLNDVENKPKFVGLDVGPGDISYKDKNGDGIINADDRYVLGDPFPHYTFGFTYDLGWNNFDLNVFIQGVGQRTMDIRGELLEPFHVNYSYVIFQHQLDFWTPTNPDAKYPRLAVVGSSSNTNNFRQGSDLNMFSGAYARLKNIQIGYTLPSKMSKSLGIQKLRVYLTGQNLLTLSKTKFVDPESTEFDNNLSAGGSNSARNYPTLLYYGAGLDINF